MKLLDHKNLDGMQLVIGSHLPQEAHMSTALALGKVALYKHMNVLPTDGVSMVRF